MFSQILLDFDDLHSLDLCVYRGQQLIKPRQFGGAAVEKKILLEMYSKKRCSRHWVEGVPHVIKHRQNFQSALSLLIVSPVYGLFTARYSLGWYFGLRTDMLAQNPGLGKFVWDEFPK